MGGGPVGGGGGRASGLRRGGSEGIVELGLLLDWLITKSGSLLV